MNHITDNHDALLDYLYEEGEPAERLTIAKHLQECPACAVAVLEFQNVRGMLSNWTPPASSSPSPSPLPRTSVDRRVRPGWGWGSRALLQAAAAVLLFVSGMAVSQLDVKYTEGALVVRTRPQAIRNASIMLPPQSASVTPASVDVDQLEQELRWRLGAQDTPSLDTENLLLGVRAMIEQSEQRQHRELALRLSQVTREVDTQHQADLLRIQQDFGKQQEATMDYLVRTSGGVK